MRTFLFFSLLSTSLAGQAQTQLYFEDFEGTGAGFALNTTDVNSMMTGSNTWLVNNVYAGGNGDVVCLGFPVTYTIPSTASQPAGISSANGNYLHTASSEAVQDNILCCSFGAADGFCTDPGNHFARMTGDVSSMGFSDVTLTFWWLCNGGQQNYGEVYYSIDSGSSWNLISTPIAQYRNQPNWTQQTITLPAFGNQATLRFGFRFVNGSSLLGGSDPGFGIDDVLLEGDSQVQASIATLPLPGTALCAGGTLNVDHTITGSFLAGNQFNAELSDALGSFASPVVIGSVTSVVPQTIACVIPLATAPGTGYRIRVVGTMPAVVGSDNGSDITILAEPQAGVDGDVTLCKNTGSYSLLQYLGGSPDPGGTWTAPGGGQHGGVLNSATDNGGIYTYSVSGGGPCAPAEATVTVQLNDPPNAGIDANHAFCTNALPASLINLVTGGELTGIFWSNGQPVASPPMLPGTYELTYIVYGTAPCMDDSSDHVYEVVAAPNAGSNATVVVCANDPPVTLVTELNGTPDAGGTWTDPLGNAHSGLFFPGIDPTGLYDYVVAGAGPCLNDTSSLAVVVDPCTGIDEEAGRENSLRVWSSADRIVMEGPAMDEDRLVMIVDQLGRELFVLGNWPVGAEQVSYSLPMLEAAVYFVRVAGANTSSTFRLVPGN
ncbi:MAG: choice-of-anchor J domain-containing protein [Flavobacteriales bacterium]|nr:choice-of-anchor J domain-containing protein [Flavobacteriales bacterium]